MKQPRAAAYLHAVPIVAFLSLAGIFSGISNRVVVEPPYLLPFLGTLFLGIVPFLLAYVAAKSYMEQGTRIFLLLGCSMIATGLANLLAAWGLDLYGGNFAVTIHNVGSLVAGSCHLVGVTLIYVGRPAARRSGSRRSALMIGGAYAAVSALLVLLSYLAVIEFLPAFFPSDGPTFIRQLVLTAAGVAYALSAVMLVALHARTRMRFFLYYADALFLMAVGLGSALLGRDVGGIMGWIGRASQYCGSFYFILALIVGWRETGAEVSSLPRYLTELFRSQLDGEVRTRTQNLLELNRRLQEEVSERKAAEERLRLSEERLRLAAEATGFGVYAYDFGKGQPYFSAELLALFGLPPGESLPIDAELMPKALLPGDRADLLSLVNAASDPHGSGILDTEFRVTVPGGQARWLRVRGRTTFHEIGGASRPAFAGGIVQDITERKIAEQRLRESEEIYRSVIENSLQGVAIIQDGRIVLCNEALCAMNGYTREEAYRMTGEQVLETVHPDDRKAIFAAMATLAETGSSPPARVIRLLNKAGGTRWVEVLGGRSLYRGRPAVQVSYVDITERRRAEEAYRSLVDHAVDGLAIILGGRVVFANAALTRICGYDVGELLGMSPEEVAGVVHPDDRDRVMKNMEQRLKDGNAPATQSFRILHRGGGTIVVETHSVMVDVEGTPAIQVTYEDVTAARTAGEELNATHRKMRNLAVHLLRAREEERRKVAQEIHDEFGQALAALKMDMHWLEKHLRGVSREAADKIKGMILLSEQTIAVVQSISAQLRPRMLDDLGLAPALDWLAADFSRRMSVSCTVETEFSPALIGGNAATTLYRVVQEALSNVARHSGARKCAIQLRASDGGITLRIEDDGVGITPAQAAAPESYGIIGIHERVEELGGHLSIEGRPGAGTVLLARIPLPQEGGLA